MPRRSDAYSIGGEAGNEVALFGANSTAVAQGRRSSASHNVLRAMHGHDNSQSLSVRLSGVLSEAATRLSTFIRLPGGGTEVSDLEEHAKGRNVPGAVGESLSELEGDLTMPPPSLLRGGYHATAQVLARLKMRRNCIMP